MPGAITEFFNWLFKDAEPRHKKVVVHQDICLACRAKDSEITTLKDQVEFLRNREVELTEVILRATRLQDPASLKRSSNSSGKESSEPPARNWQQLRAKLEDKHRRSPGDAVKSRWEVRVQEMEKEAGIVQQSNNPANPPDPSRPQVEITESGEVEAMIKELEGK